VILQMAGCWLPAMIAWYVSSMSELTIARQAIAHRGRLLEYFTIVWNFLEGLIAIAAVAVSGSISLVGFGIDSCHRGNVWCQIAEEDVGRL
jgi:hypothetical protein